MKILNEYKREKLFSSFNLENLKFMRQDQLYYNNYINRSTFPLIRAHVNITYADTLTRYNIKQQLVDDMFYFIFSFVSKNSDSSYLKITVTSVMTEFRMSRWHFEKLWKIFDALNFYYRYCSLSAVKIHIADAHASPSKVFLFCLFRNLSLPVYRGDNKQYIIIQVQRVRLSFRARFEVLYVGKFFLLSKYCSFVIKTVVKTWDLGW